MKLEDRINAIAEFGFTERQARFLDVVMMFGGLCVPRQYATFAGTAYGHTVSRFFDKLVQRGYATVCDCLHNRAELYHVRHRALYRAIDEPHSRYRRPVPAHQVLDRLMRLDAVVIQPDLIWLATEEETGCVLQSDGSVAPARTAAAPDSRSRHSRAVAAVPGRPTNRRDDHGSRGVHLPRHRLGDVGAPGLRPAPR
jgi:hypothetical protein